MIQLSCSQTSARSAGSIYSTDMKKQILVAVTQKSFHILSVRVLVCFTKFDTVLKALSNSAFC